MNKNVKTIEELKAAGCSAALSYLMYDTYMKMPSAKYLSDSEATMENIRKYDAVISSLFRCRTVDDYLDWFDTSKIQTGVYSDEDNLYAIEDQLLATENPNEALNKAFLDPSHAEQVRRDTETFGMDYALYAFNQKTAKGIWERIKVKTGGNETLAKLSLLDDEAMEGYSEKYQQEIKADKEALMKIYESYSENWTAVNIQFMTISKAPVSDNFNMSDESFVEEIQKFITDYNLKGFSYAPYLSNEEVLSGMQKMRTDFDRTVQALDLPREMIGINGTLSFFYGSTVPGSLGCYEPISHTFYIAKDMSMRVMTHEWFHALDFSISKKISQYRDILLSPPSSDEGVLLYANKDFDAIKENTEKLFEAAQAKSFENKDRADSLKERFLASDGIFWNYVKTAVVPEILKKASPDSLHDVEQRINKAFRMFYDREISPEMLFDYINREAGYGAMVNSKDSKEFSGESMEFIHGLDTMAKIYWDLDKAKIAKENKEEYHSDLIDMIDDGHNLFHVSCVLMDSEKGQQYYTNRTEVIARLGEQLVLDLLDADFNGHKHPQYLTVDKEAIQPLFKQWVESAKGLVLGNEMKKTRKMAIK